MNAPQRRSASPPTAQTRLRDVLSALLFVWLFARRGGQELKEERKVEKERELEAIMVRLRASPRRAWRPARVCSTYRLR